METYQRYNSKSHENKLPNELTTNDISTTDPHIISETLNKFLSTISEKLKSEHPQENPEFNTFNLDDYIVQSDSLLTHATGGLFKSRGRSCNQRDSFAS